MVVFIVLTSTCECQQADTGISCNMNEYTCTLSEKAKLHASQFLNEDECLRDLKVLRLQEWLETQPHLHAKLDYLSVLWFLRGCKFDEEKAKKKLRNFYTLRSKAPEWFHQRDPHLPELRELLNLGIMLPLPDRDEHGRLVVIIRAAVHNPKQHLQSDFFKLCKMILEVLFHEDESISVFGVVAVVDLSRVSLSHALELTPSVVGKAVHSWQDCYPVRLKMMEFVNVPIHVNVILNIFRRFMTEKLRSRVHVHRNSVKTLLNVISPDILPKEYGGDSGSVQDIIDYWKQHLLEKREWLLEDEKHKADRES